MVVESAGIGLDNHSTTDSSRPATILLVEDESRVREVMEMTLSLNGYQVLAVGSATEALEIIEKYEDTIEMMVTDFALPHMNGVTLAARLKRLRPHAKVLYVSGFPKQDVLDFHERGGRSAIEFLQKPFTPETLEAKVSSLLADA
jgi:two-component system, cell cycle sensor histidine kinase and response regulator CckA